MLTDKIPNKSLNGLELRKIAVKQFDDMLAADCMFSPNIGYRRVAFTLEAVFHVGQPIGDIKVRSRVKTTGGALEGEAPLVPQPDPEDAAFVALARDVAIDNPNLARVQADLPIRVTEKVSKPILMEPTLPGEPQQATEVRSIETRELKYDKTDYPKPPAPVDRDVTEQKAKELGVKRTGGMGLQKR